jgi:ABC-type Mn2+/Zn2+ transport system ATPase subunit
MITDTTILETPDEARARVFRMDKIERRLAYLAQADKFEERILLTIDEAIKILETCATTRRRSETEDVQSKYKRAYAGVLSAAGLPTTARLKDRPCRLGAGELDKEALHRRSG